MDQSTMDEKYLEKSNLRKFQMVKLEFAMYHQKFRKHLHCMVARRGGWRKGQIGSLGWTQILYTKWVLEIIP